LVQDGHRLEHVFPPRDLQSWHQLPVSGIATFNPVVIADTSPDGIRKALEAYPYQRFPVIQQGVVGGIVTRKEAEAALSEKRLPNLEPAVTCLPHETIRDLQAKLIGSTSLIAVVVDQPGGRLLGLVTLHDLLRAEVAIAKESSA